jgi:hypothetical protein
LQLAMLGSWDFFLFLCSADKASPVPINGALDRVGDLGETPRNLEKTRSLWEMLPALTPRCVRFRPGKRDSARFRRLDQKLIHEVVNGTAIALT